MIDTSIELFLNYQDHVSVHVLAWAATDMLRGVADAAGKLPLLGKYEEHIPVNLLKEFRHGIRKSYNSAKHADKDPDAEIEYFPIESSAYILFAASHDYQSIYSTQSWPMWVFSLWFLARYPQFCGEEHKPLVAPVSEIMGRPSEQSFEQCTAGALAVLRDKDFYCRHLKKGLPAGYADAIEWP